MRLLLCIPALLALVSCVGADSTTPDSADSAPLVADHELVIRSAVRCADATLEECYVSESEVTLLGQPGERFGLMGVEGCPTGPDAELSAYIGGGTLDDAGESFQRVDLAFDCGEAEPVDGYLFTAEYWMVGDMGSVLPVWVEAGFNAE